MKKILLIEDDRDSREATAAILKLANYEVLSADSGRAGVEIAFRENPDIIISNLKMNGLDGYGVLHLLHKHPGFYATPFIFLGGTNAFEEQRRAMSSGADDYFTTPLDESQLLSSIEYRLKKAEEIKNTFTKIQRYENNHGELTTDIDDIKSFIEGRNIDRYNKRQKIYEEGQRPTKLYYIRKGKVKLCKSSDEGKELIVELCGAGDFLGHVALLEDSVYHESAETMEFTEVSVIPRQDFEELMATNPLIAKKFIRMLARSISEQERHMVGIAYNSLRKKVAEAILILRKKYPPLEDEQLFKINLSREDLANIAGTATESLIRTLSDFKTEKIIEISHDGTISLINEKKLANLFN